MEMYFPHKAFNTSTRKPTPLQHRLPLLPLIVLLVTQWLWSTAASAANATLQPYSAVYAASYKGMSAEARQTLTASPSGQFTLKRDVDSMFVKLYEQSEFQLRDNNFTVSRYTYQRGGLASKKNIEQLFQWDKGNLHVTENKRSRDVAIKPPLFDKLSYTEALRLQLLAAGTLPKNISIAFADRHHMKKYDFIVGDQEDVSVPAGKMRAVKLERHVPEDNKHTTIWVAPELDYLLIKLEQTDDGDRQELYLKSYEPAKAATPQTPAAAPG
jgi:hypothetical protein